MPEKCLVFILAFIKLLCGKGLSNVGTGAFNLEFTSEQRSTQLGELIGHKRGNFQEQGIARSRFLFINLKHYLFFFFFI